ncbi:hypothetical protein ACJZ2D_015255 [Fusarium nematophilum]
MAANPDIPIPSTETGSNGVSNDGSTPTTSPNRLSTPSVSISPPPSTPRNGVNGRLREPSDGIASHLQNVRLSDPPGISNLSEIAEAVEGVARGSDNRAASLTPEPNGSRAGTPRQRRRGRRSSARQDKVPHDVLDEELPQDAFHSPEFQQAFRDAKQLMSRVESVLGSSSLHTDPDSTMRRLHEEAGELARFEYPSTRTVGFVGDSGVGKSSLLNSLLDTKGLARTSNSGEACTCVVTEYHYHNRDTYDIVVNLFTMDELRDQLARMVETYRHFHLHGDEMEDAERRDMEASANVARDTFRAMFRGHLDDEDFLIEQSERRVLSTLTRWAADARPSDLITRQTGLSLGACSTALMKLSSEPPSRDEPATWPYIKSTKVFLNAHILSRGLVLVDLPGLRDLNSARRIITERYLLECNEIFAICNIGRAVSDEGVHHVFELARRARLSNVGIVCTRSDDIQAEEAIRDWRGEKAKTIKQLLHAIATDEKDEKDVQEELDDYEGEEDLSEDERDHQTDLWRRKESIRTRNKNHQLELKTYLVTTRNAFVTSELRQKYNARVDEIKVFCVSNKDYWDQRQEPKQTSLPFLQLSGILLVRKHCISIVANSQRRIATRYMKDQIPALLAQVNLWVQSGARTAGEEQREALCRRLDEVERRLRRGLTSSSSEVGRVGNSFKQDFTDHVYGRRRISSWTRSAKEAAEEWQGWHHQTYSAFTRNYGDHFTSAVGSHNWNEEAMEGMSGDLETPWEDLLLRLQERQTSLGSHIETITDEAIERFDTEDDDETEHLVEALMTRQQILLDAIEQVNENFDRELGVVHADSLSGIRSSLIGRAMEQPYRRCIQEGGRGSDARRKAIIRGALGNEDLFSNLMRSFRDAFREKADDSQRRIHRKTKAYLDAVQETFDLVRSENVARESEQDPEFRNRVDEAMRTGRETIQRVHGAIGV